MQPFFCPNPIVWGDVATGLGATATAAAAIVALYLSNRGDKPKASGELNILIYSDNWNKELICFVVRNLGTHRLTINSCFVTYKWIIGRVFKWPSAIAHNWQHPINNQLPANLERGETFNYATDAIPAMGFGEFLAKSALPAWMIPYCIKAGVSTPWGPIYVQITKSMRKTIVSHVMEIRSLPKEPLS